MENNIVIIIPARMGSTRLPGKPLADIGGKPMIVHVMEKALAALLGPVFIACDDDEIAEVVTQAGGIAIMTEAYHPSGTDRIYEALCKIDRQKQFDIIINLQGDLPFIDPSIIRNIANLLQNSSAMIGTAAAEIHNNQEILEPSVVKPVISLSSNNTTGKAVYFSRNPVPYNAPKYYHHIGVYAYRRSALEQFVTLEPSYLENIEKLEQLRAIENNIPIDITIVDRIPISVDTLQDLEKARKHFLSLNSK
ncbi:3-deoxy-manno-octulosonate cytidylyltransferase [Rickettsiales bacterium Ac37b]|nr:3-deoxy-manno-octulosonate cytidylyltransferase [Rickettsiales bacterium Ac37b]